MQTISRKVYGILDWLGDIGGLAGALKALFTALIIVFQYKAAINYVSNHTYLIRDGEDQEQKKNNVNAIEMEELSQMSKESDAKMKRIPIGFWASIKLSF